MAQETKFTPKLMIHGMDYIVSDGISTGKGNSADAAHAAFKEDRAFNQEKYIPQINQDMYEALQQMISLAEIGAEALRQNARLELTGGAIVGDAAARDESLAWFQIEEAKQALAKVEGKV